MRRPEPIVQIAELRPFGIARREPELAAFQISGDETPNSSLKRVFWLNIAMAALYAGAGWLGLRLAVPPGYATVIWPASGLAVAGLLLYGRYLMPGILLGSFAVNCVIGGAFAGGTFHTTAIVIAMSIAAGSTLQAFIGASLIGRIFGRPIMIEGYRDIATIALIGGPLSCLVAATVGTVTLFATGFVSGPALLANWLTWWTGDMVGVLVFMPLALLNPWRPWTIKWSGRDVATFSTATLLSVILPLGVTFYAWVVMSDAIHKRNERAFATLAVDSEHALLYRLDSYRQSLDSGAGLFQASGRVTLPEWTAFVETLEIEESLPGINGIGFIESVKKADLPAFPARAVADGVEGMRIHPDGEVFGDFIIKYIVPGEVNREAVGLNIAFEKNRYEAAVNARDTGRATITKRIFLVQDRTRSAGFLLLRPLYRGIEDAGSVEARRKSFKGWIYAPFVAPRFMDALTSGQGTIIDIAVYDGSEPDPDQLIYSSRIPENRGTKPAYTVRKTLPVMQQTWTLEWHSTPAYESSVKSAEPLLILVGGTALSFLFGALLLSYARREESIRSLVTEKTRELVAREQQTRSIVDTAMVAILLLDRRGQVLSVNQAAEKIFGSSASRMIGVKFEDLTSDSRMSNDWLKARGVEGTDDPSLQDYKPVRIINNLGQELYLDIQFNGWTNESGEERFTAIIRNVTTEIGAKFALQETEQRWKYALEGSNIGVFDIDLANNKSIVSAKWLEMLGFGPGESIDPQAEWRARIHEEDQARVIESDRACLNRETERSITEYRIRKKDGTWIWMRSDAVVVDRDSSGNARRMIGTQTDITNLKNAEAALKASEERFRTAIQDAPVGMAMLTLDRKWIKVNAALCDLLGYTEEELIGMDPSDNVHPDDLSADTVWAEALTEGRTKSYQRELRYRHKNGAYIWVLFSVSIAEDPYDKSKYFIGQVQDITDQKEMERLKTEFVSTVSHELRTPLTSIRASLGLVLGAMAQELPENAKRLITIAHSNCERLVPLINDILDLEKVSSGEMRIDMRSEALAGLLEESVAANQGYAAQFKVRLELDAPVPDCTVEVDQSRFHQVLANLLSNAAKFSPQGGTVRVKAEMIEDHVRISVTDQGAGIPPEFRPKIFGRFSQADSSSSRAKGGTGLGLHISQQLVERMNGKIGFETVSNEGTTFWIDLPAAMATDAFAINEINLSGIDYPLVLHVEDDHDFCEVVAAYLSGKANVVSTATTRGARSWISMIEFDLVILDIGLHNGNGLDLIEKTHEKGIPVIVLSAREDIPRDPRVSRYISKSRVTEKELVAIVTSHLNSSPKAENEDPKRAGVSQ